MSPTLRRSRTVRAVPACLAVFATLLTASACAAPRAKPALAPDTSIAGGPADGATVTATTAAFTLRSSRPASFRCSLDGRGYAGCTSPKTYARLTPRRHSLRVRAVTSTGVRDATPATRSWTVAAVPALPAAGCSRPYSASSPWNREIAADVAVDPDSAAKVATMDPRNEKLTSDPTQYTFPVYYADASTPRVRVTYVDGWFSDVSASGTLLVNSRSIDPFKRVTTMPVPAEAIAAAGYDAQVVVVDAATGEEWDASHFTKDETGYHAWNIGHYSTAWSAVPPYDADGNPYWIRGPGIPYLAGLMRPCEIAQGRIDHALAFAYPETTPEFVYPAARSDGQSAVGTGMAEGTRLQLDPSIADTTIRTTWGCTGACYTIAKALQRYGMYIADGSGRPKIMPEYEGTARWAGTLSASAPSPIPLSAFRVVAAPPH